MRSAIDFRSIEPAGAPRFAYLGQPRASRDDDRNRDYEVALTAGQRRRRLLDVAFAQRGGSRL